MVILGDGGGVRVGVVFVVVRRVFVVLGCVVKVRCGGELGQGCEDALYGEVWFVLVW